MYTHKFAKLRHFMRLFCTSESLKRKRILGIETSCDDTSIAIVDSDKNILGEATYSQAEAHAMHGGIIPQLAKNLHGENIRKATHEAVEKSELSIKDLDAIAVTVKPGLPSSLEVGIEYAKDLCSLYEKPLIPIHHMEAHALTIRLLQDVEFPFLVLLVSGGHCILALAEGITKFSVLGETKDISPGVFLDRAARRLRLRNIKDLMLIQGGPAIEYAARKGKPFQIQLPFFRKGQRDCSFSFSGYHTTILNYIENEEKRLNIEANGVLPHVYDICASVQFELFRYICEKVETGIRYLRTKQVLDNKNVLVVSGGVASNEYMRKMLKHVCRHYEYDLLIPPKHLCTDNGVMVAWNAIERLRENIPPVSTADLNTVELCPSSPLGKDLSPDVRYCATKEKFLELSQLMRQEMELELNPTLRISS